MAYKGYEFIFQQGVRVVRNVLNKEEEEWLNLESELIKLDESTLENGQLELPRVLNGKEVRWEKPGEYRGIYILIIGWIISILLVFKKKQDLDQLEICKHEQMERDYPQVISAFMLYMGAGMTSKNAWVKIVESYQVKGRQRFIYEEMQRTYQEMLNSKSEIEAYESFGERVENLRYRKFSLLLAQNVKKGTKGMVEILERETQEAFNERKRKAKSLGEEAGTKLLLPMFLMLSIVLCIIVIPAFLSVQL